jgi:hypothetical protein
LAVDSFNQDIKGISRRVVEGASVDESMLFVIDGAWVVLLGVSEVIESLESLLYSVESIGKFILALNLFLAEGS